MTVAESQKTGVVAVVILCLALYGFSFRAVSQPTPAVFPVGGVQNPRGVAVEIRGPRGEGIYFFPPGVAFNDVSRIAGIGEARSPNLLPSTKIEHGALLTLTRERKIVVGKMSAAKRLALGIPLDINHASAYDLALVPGIGDGAAARMVLLRKERGRFSSIDELMDIPGIKKKRLDKMRRFLTVETISSLPFDTGRGSGGLSLRKSGFPCTEGCCCCTA